MRNDSETHETDTGLHGLRSCECHPVTPVECVSLSFCTHPCLLAFTIYIVCTKGIEMALVKWIQHKKVTCSYIFFKFIICSIALLSLGETCHLKGRDMVTVWRTVLLLSCYDYDSSHQHYDVTRIEYVLWRRTMHEWVMNIHYQTWIPLNMIRTPLKQWGMCDNLSILTCKPDPCRDSPAYNTKTFGFLPGWAMGCSIWVFYIRYTRYPVIDTNAASQILSSNGFCHKEHTCPWTFVAKVTKIL